MPKSILVDPNEMRQRGELSLPSIPINRYTPDPAAETAYYGPADLVRMHRDMVVIREFETMLDEIKTQGTYQDIEIGYRGPAHLSIGQEATVVGQAYHLTTDDHIFGSHRSHGEILAKSLRSIEQLDAAELTRIMETYLDGEPLRAVEDFPESDNEQTLALNYVLYGTLAEIFGRRAGFNRGMGGSMHAFFAPFGIMPNNAIVGGSAPIATGAALFKRVHHEPGVVIANIGDASAGCGPVWEAMMFSAMDQYRTLWNNGDGGGLPIIFNFMNNFYGMGGQPMGETMGFGVLARLGAGVNPAAMHAERVDGYNPLAVADAMARKLAVLQNGGGPVLLDTITYRYAGHSPSDASAYREREEIEAWQQHDATATFRAYLIDNDHATAAELDAHHEDIRTRLARVLYTADSAELSPRLVEAGLEGVMFSNGDRPALRDGPPDVRLPLDETRYKITQKKHRFGLDTDSNPLPKLKCVTYAEAIFEAMIHRFYEDPSMIAYGEENRDWGGAFGAYRGLTEALPYHRLFNAPISEAAIAGTAVGYALSGGRVVAELMYADFMGRAGDEIFNQMAKWQAMSAGVLQMPLVLRVSVGMKYGAQHSQDWTSLVAHIPGLKVYFPATAYDAKGMLNRALRGTDPVIFFESQRLYSQPETIVSGGVPIGYYEIQEGAPVVRRTGDDVTIITVGAVLGRALAAADRLQDEFGLSAEVIDARFINPLDYALLVDSARKTGRVLLVSDACERGSFLHTMASNLTQLAFSYLDGPITVVGSRNWITPPADMEDLFFPGPDWIIDTLHERILPLPGYEPATVQTTGEIVRRNRLGV